MKIFIDTNILVDLLTNRGGFTQQSIRLFRFTDKPGIRFYTSTHIIVTLHYLLKKYVPEKELRNTLLDLLDFVELIAANPVVIKQSLMNSSISDFEDAVQFHSANQISNMNFIVTRNLKDFKGTSIPALAADEMIRILESEK